MATEIVSGTVSLTGVEQVVATLTSFHERVSVAVAPQGQANATLSRWRVYAIADGAKVLLFEGTLSPAGAKLPAGFAELVVNGIEGSGNTIQLVALSVSGATGAVEATIIGWDPGFSESPDEAFANGSVHVSNAEQDVCTFSGDYSNFDVLVNTHNDPLAARALFRLYTLEDTKRTLVGGGLVSPLLGQQKVISDLAAGGDTFVLTVQGSLGTSAVLIDGVILAKPSTQGGGGPTPPPTGNFWPYDVPLAAGIVAPILEQAPAASDVVPQNIVMHAQDAHAGAAINQVGGDLIFSSGAGVGSPEVDGAIHFRGGNSASDILTIESNGTVSAAADIACPEYIVVNNGVGRTPAIVSGVGVPAPSTVSAGSLNLSNTYNGLYVQAEDESHWNAVPILDAVGSVALDPASTEPGLSQVQSATGAGTTLRIISQAAETGSTTSGGDMSFILAADDPPSLYPTNPRLFWFGTQTAIDGHEPATNYNNVAILKWLPGGVANLLLGGGTNDIGGGVAGVEISSFTQLGIATENDALILNEIAGTGPTTTTLNRTAHDTTDEAALTLAYTGNHPTSGDVSGLEIDYTETAIGSGFPRYIDIKKGGTREFSIVPLSGLTGVDLISAGYVRFTAPTAVLGASPAFQFLNAGVFGLKIDASAAQLGLDTGVANSSIQIDVAGVNAIELTGTKFKTQQGRNRHTTHTTVDYNILDTDDVVIGDVGSPGGITLTLPGAPADGDQYTAFNGNTGGVTLDGNGHNILAGTSAATKLITQFLALKVVYSSAIGAWLGSAGL